jgi:FAD/FMN-containing dehydrogenase
MTGLTVTTLGGERLVEQAVVDEFRTRLRGPLVTPGEAGYDEARQIHNGMHDKRPALIVRCSGVADVVEAVNFARAHDLLLAVRGGGHNVAGHAACDGGLVIDLSAMRSIHVDPSARTARVQGGATLGDLDRETQVFGLAVPAGNVSTTGVGGLTLGGGMGHLRRKHGLAIDNLLSAQVVLASGEVVTASPDEHADLFWGLRGGGGNFGVVTSFEFRLHPVGPLVTLCAPWYPVDDAKAILAAWRDFMDKAPEEFSCLAAFWTIPAAPGIPEEHHGKRALLFGGVHCGPVDEGQKFIQPLRELGTPMLDLSGPAPWAAVQAAFDPFFPKGLRRYYFKSRYLKHLDDSTIAALLPRAINPPAPPVLIALWHLGGAMHRVGSTETAFAEREAAFLFSVDAIWDDPEISDEVVAYARRYLTEMEPYLKAGLYVNFAGLGEEGESLVRAAYGPNYDRLVAVKNRYDPGNLFRLNQNIKPAA